jgi:hypothetical protein
MFVYSSMEFELINSKYNTEFTRKLLEIRTSFTKYMKHVEIDFGIVAVLI